jgi:hypothetical protein
MGNKNKNWVRVNGVAKSEHTIKASEEDIAMLPRGSRARYLKLKARLDNNTRQLEGWKAIYEVESDHDMGVAPITNQVVNSLKARQEFLVKKMKDLLSELKLKAVKVSVAKLDEAKRITGDIQDGVINDDEKEAIAHNAEKMGLQVIEEDEYYLIPISQFNIEDSLNFITWITPQDLIVTYNEEFDEVRVHRNLIKPFIFAVLKYKEALKEGSKEVVKDVLEIPEGF